MPFGLIEAALFFGIVLALAIVELWRTKKSLRARQSGPHDKGEYGSRNSSTPAPGDAGDKA